MLRGNHEEASISRIYGFYDDCKRRFGNIKYWKKVNDTFNCLPLAAIIDKRIFCVHAGLSPELTDISQIAKVERPLSTPDHGLVCDLLWSDPDDVTGWCDGGGRGVSYQFGGDVVAKFLEQNDFDLMVRAHQVVEDGYEFFADRRLVTVFSASNYVGEFDNAGAVMSVDPSLLCSFQVLQPKQLKA
eukprot:Hpha_TRINITY_DN16021_c0_g1::TRINITY_DN16021_c0_g1_i1::g.120983::m.120983/K06269/PPP1C; serine/threonine-protein phosphatase PP1 catalytic subunit